MNIKERFKFIEQIQQPKEEKKHDLPSGVEIESLIDGELIHNKFGTAFVTTKTFQMDYQHGMVRFNQINEVSPQFLQLAGKDQNLQQLDINKSIFFDTETTGLAGGSGTYIFMLGVGFFSNDNFILKQFFLRDFPDEPAMLYAIHEIFEQFENIISFNGKSFDMPLLQSRFLFHRIISEPKNLPHLDLLHASRRIWKNRLTDCSLGTIENQIMGIHRYGDIPSYLIPQLYFEYLRTKNAQPVKQVFYHNEVDILSLVSLTILLNNIHKQPLEQLENNIDLKTLAKHYENSNQWLRNIEIYNNLLRKENSPDDNNEIKLKLSYCYKKIGQWEQAVKIWEELLNCGTFLIEPYEELAKYYEHRLTDYHTAEHIVKKAIENLEIVNEIKQIDSYTVHRDGLIHRLDRIRRKKDHFKLNNKKQIL